VAAEEERGSMKTSLDISIWSSDPLSYSFTFLFVGTLRPLGLIFVPISWG